MCVYVCVCICVVYMTDYNLQIMTGEKLVDTCRYDTVLEDQATRRFVGGTIKDWSDHSCSSAVFKRCRGSFNVFLRRVSILAGTTVSARLAIVKHD